jgi:tetratricopeptide (TPR) repeat protein
LVFSGKAQALAERLGFGNRTSFILANIGNVYDDKGDYVKALDYYMKALKMNEETGNEKRNAAILSDIGIVYYDQGDYPNALDFYLKALSMSEDLGNKNGVAATLADIGIVYSEMGDTSKAVDYFQKALKMDKELGYEQLEADNLISIGQIYSDKGDVSKGLDCYREAIRLFEKFGDKAGISATTSSIGSAYIMLGNSSQALNYFEKALKMDEELGNKSGIAANKGNIGELYTKLGKFKEAEDYLKQSETLSDSIGDKSNLKTNEMEMYELYDTTGRYQLALEHYKKAMALKDTLFNIEKNKAIMRKQMTFEFEKKEAAEKAEQDKKDAITAADKRKEKVVIWSIGIGFIAVLLFAGFIFRSLRLTSRQKQVIEKKNKEILDSITYAKRLQDAILPPLSIINKYLPESFLLYKPKDIVAGDFYWMERTGHNILIAAADCTGHGVPGALVSVVCSNALNRTVKEFHITEPGKILDKVRELVLETFEKSENNVQDGMDISLCCINTNTNELQWSGAYNSLWYIQKGKLHEVPADKQPIGKMDRPQPFNTHNLHLQKGDTVYLFTDGYADQFGGPKGKKFKYKQLEELLLANRERPMEEQKNALESTLEDWKGGLEQVDDILMIGIRV